MKQTDLRVPQFWDCLLYTSRGGSGEFAADEALSVSGQIEQAKKRVGKKIKNGKYIAYFQAFTNTYAPVSYTHLFLSSSTTNM